MNKDKITIGNQIPTFSLKNVDGNIISSTQYQGKPLLVVFSCNHCPYVHAYEERLLNLAREFPQIQFIFINSNDVANYPDDSPEKMRERAKEKGYLFPYLYDETQETAKAFGGACTPDPFLFNKKHELYYRGRIDDNVKQPDQVEEESLKQAIKQMLENKEAPEQQFPAIGCSIKWK